jgi:hypothetical protein
LTAGLFAIVASPLLGLLAAVALCRGARELGGRPAFKHYVVCSVVGFLLCAMALVGPMFFAEGTPPPESPAFFTIGPMLALFFYGFIGSFIIWGLAAAGCWPPAPTDGDSPSLP